MGRFFAFLLVVLAIGGFVAWQYDMIPTIPGTQPDHTDPYVVKLDLGGPLYKSQDPPRTPFLEASQRSTPVVVPGNLTVIEKMDACASIPGQILFVGEEIDEGACQIAGVAPLLQQKIYPATVNQGERNVFKLYYRLSEGEVIGTDGMVAMIDPAKASHGVLEKQVKLNAAKAESEAAEKIDYEAERRLQIELRLGQFGTELDRSNAILTQVKTRAETIAKREAVRVAEIDLQKERLNLSLHQIRNRLPVKSSLIKTIYKHTGEAVKELDPVLHLYALERLMAEGLVEMQFAPQLALGRKVSVEPSREVSPLRVWRSHKKEITAVTVTHDGRAVSASEDGTVCLWDERYDGPVHLLRHSQPVRAVACSPAGAAMKWCVAGLADGTITVWDLASLKEGEEPRPLKSLKSRHTDAVTALAFNRPDGKFFASGSADGSIMLWSPDAPPEHVVYPFDDTHGVEQPHSGQVTSLHFSPFGRLVSAARDNTLRVWELHEKGARLVSEPIAGRSGTVSQLGVSQDGRFMLFDQGKTLQILTHDGRTLTTVQNPAGVIPFETLAIFSPDASLMLTAGAAEGRLQLWRAPTDGTRGFELSQLVTSERASVTSAAFFDAGPTGEVPFAVSGTKDGIVYLWRMLSRSDIATHRIQNVKLTQISQNVETRQVRIGVEVSNHEGRLIPGQTVTIVIE